MSNEITGIKLLFNPVSDTMPLFRLQGQLGLGEDRIHISAPCLLSFSQLAEVTQIQAGDSYSAAMTGEPNIQHTVVDRREVTSFPQLYYFDLKVLSAVN